MLNNDRDDCEVDRWRPRWRRELIDPVAKPTPRRRFSAAYKLAILVAQERRSDSGAKGAVLRREGLYASHIVE